MPYLLGFFLGGRTHYFDILAVCIHCSGHAAPRWGKLAVICCHFKDCFWKIGTLNRTLQKKRKPSAHTEAWLKWAHMINMAVLLKWNVANGGGEGWWRGLRGIGGGRGVWQDVAMAFKGMGMFGWHGPPPAPLPLFMCHSLSSSL